MNNFEKFKKELTVERLADMIATAYCVVGCDFCTYKSRPCPEDCEYGIKKWLESEVE